MNTPPPFTAAVVQASPVFFDRQKTLEKIIDYVDQAARQHSKIILFPEVIIPGYPRGLLFGTAVGSRTEEGREQFLRYWENAIEVPGPETISIAQAARKAKAYVVVGVTEKDRLSDTLYCTLLYFSPEGELIQRHRKLKPTAAERIIWGEGAGDDLQIADTPLGKIGGLICWENYMPLARTALYQQGLEIYLAPTADCRGSWQATLQHIAVEGRCFVLGCNQFLTTAQYPPNLAVHQPETFPTPELYGGSCILSPLGTYLAGPLFGEEGILTAELDHRSIIKAKMDFDPVGHYARPDVFELRVKGQSTL